MVNYSKRVGARTKADIAVSKGLGGIRGILRFMTAIFMALCMFLLAGCARTEKDARRYIKNVSGIEVPAESELIYQYYQSYFQDRSPQYTVFQFERDPVEWLDESGFSEEKSEEFERDFMWDVHGWAKIPFPEEYIPTFENSYSWLELKPEYVYFIYMPQKQWLIVFIIAMD